MFIQTKINASLFSWHFLDSWLDSNKLYAWCMIASGWEISAWSAMHFKNNLFSRFMFHALLYLQYDQYKINILAPIRGKDSILNLMLEWHCDLPRSHSNLNLFCINTYVLTYCGYSCFQVCIQSSHSAFANKSFTAKSLTTCCQCCSFFQVGIKLS